MGVVARLVCGRRTKWLTLVVWLLVAIGLSGLSSRLSDVEQNDMVAWLPTNAESTQQLRALQGTALGQTVEAQVVYERIGGVTAADRAKVAADARAFAAVSGVVGPVGAEEPSDDGEALQVRVPVRMTSAGWDEVKETVDQLREIATTGADGLSVHVAGQAGNSADQAAAFGGVDGLLLAVAALVVVALLLFTYRSPTLWLLPMVAVSVALVVTQALMYLLARYGSLTVDAQSVAVLTVVVFGVGTDYALLLIARYREELRRYADRHEAMAVALRRAGPAAFASAATVAIGVLCLMFAGMRSTAGLGPVVAIGVLITIAAMLSLLPALLTTFGRWVFWPVRPVAGSPQPRGGAWLRAGQWVVAKARPVWLVTALVLAVAALGMVSLRTDGLSYADTFVGRPDSVVGQEVIARHYDSGVGSPALIVARADKGEEVQRAAAAVPGVASASVGAPIGDGSVLITAVFTDPADTPAAEAAVQRLRTAVHAVPDADALVGGQTAVRLDIEDTSRRDNRIIIPLVLAVVLLILVAVLRAVVAPLLLIASVVLSLAAAVGVSTLIFDHAFGFGGADTNYVLLVFVFLVVFGTDYNIFLMTRIREEAVARSTRWAAIRGVAATGGVITSAGLVLAGTFAALTLLPAVSFVEIGFTVAFGVLLDTFLVRTALVPALTSDLGRWVWWPSALSRRAARRRGDAAPHGAARRHESPAASAPHAG